MGQQPNHKHCKHDNLFKLVCASVELYDGDKEAFACICS